MPPNRAHSRNTVKSWLYPISPKHTIARKRVSNPRDWQELVESGRLSQDDEWHVPHHTREIKARDEIFIYLVPSHSIVGYARISSVNAPEEEVKLKFDRQKCLQLAKQPIAVSPSKIRKWVGNVRNAVRDVSSHAAELHRQLSEVRYSRNFLQRKSDIRRQRWENDILAWPHFSERREVAEKSVEFFGRAFNEPSRMYPRRAWFGALLSRISLTIGNIFLAGMTVRGWTYLLVDKKVKGLDFEVAPSTKRYVPLGWAEGSWEEVGKFLASKEIWRSYARACKKVLRSPISNNEIPKNLKRKIRLSQIARASRARRSANRGKRTLLSRLPIRHEKARHNEFRSTAFTPEFAGPRKSYAPPKRIRSDARHGRVVNRLRQSLVSKGLVTRNDQARDLFILSRRGRMQSLFEVKTSLETSDVYEGIGQLFFHTSVVDSIPKRILVLPGKPSERTAQALRRLGILVLRYSWRKDKPRFFNLEEVLRA